MFQKVKQMCRKAKGFIQGVSTKVKMLALTLFSGTTAMAQSTAGDYSAGTTALSTVAEEIVKYVPVMVKLCYAIAGVVAIIGAISVYIAMNNEEQEDHDGGWCMSFPDCSSTGSSFVFRH